MMTSAVETSIQATSPLLGTGVEAAAAAGAAADAPAEAAAAAAGAAVAAALAAAAPEAAASAAAGWADAVPPTNSSRPRRKARRSLFMVLFSRASERVLAGLAGADANDLLEGRDEDLPVADLAGARRPLDR